MNFRLSTEQLDGDGCLISFVGEADPNSAPALKRELVQAIDRGTRHVVVDLTETTFIDSTTLGILIGGAKRQRSRGGDLSLVCGDDDIRIRGVGLRGLRAATVDCGNAGTVLRLLCGLLVGQKVSNSSCGRVIGA